ncbi:MAG: 3-deoxy-7-phosphoheptulonate synthase [Firmicutes bacterium]|nr:3-deoxy-7-phosphoheptulonate synthase [Bacillota bacterium]
MNMLFKRRLPAPQDVIKMYPLSEKLASRKNANDKEIRGVLEGKIKKFLLIIGPCSADRKDAVLEYATRLRAVQEKVSDKLILVPRIYTNKPRTTGAGYKGMLHQSDPHRAPDMFRGLISIRRLHIRCLEETGFSGADEMLYPENHRYLADILSYVAVGARSAENQQHRLTASGLDVPVGFKNPTSGDLSVMLNAVTAAQSPHDFSYGGFEVQSTGNPLAHAILRGSVNRFGTNLPNYHYEDLTELSDLYEKSSLQNPAVIVDANHSNSGKRYEEQPRIAKEILHSMKHNAGVARLVKGVMIESYLQDGCQKITESVYGKSITDPCLGWEKSERLIYEIAELLP